MVQRRRDIAIRSTLGARPRDIIALVVREGMLVTGAGIAAGLVVAAGVTRMLGGLLFDVRPVDPVTLTGAAGLFVVISLLAMLIPIGRALRVDPALALRDE